MAEPFDKQLWDLRWGVKRSIRYHSRRQGFFQFWHTLVMVVTLMASSATIVVFSSALSEGWPLVVKLIPAVLIALLSILDVAVGFSGRAWRHADFVRQFTDLELDILDFERRIEDEPEDDPGKMGRKGLARLTARRLKIEVSEPPVLRVLDTLCHNELLRAMDYPPSEQIEVAFWQRWTAHFVDLGQHRLTAQEG